MMKKVLVAEDDQFLADSYQTRLGRENLQVIMAHDGKEAVALTKSESPQLIILDLIMPIMDGVEALNLLKTDPQTQHIPIIIATNNDSQSVVKQCKDAGAAEVFIKSNITIDKLVSICQKYLN